jgi:hypothetical protein
MVKPGIKSLLQEIQSGDIDFIYIHITEKAIEWVSAGFIEEANTLLEQLWKFKIPHTRDVWLIDEALQVVWEINSKQPEEIPFKLKEISGIEQENWQRNFYPVWSSEYTNEFIKKSIDELKGKELFVKAIISGGEQSENNSKILDAFKRYIEEDNPDNASYLTAATCGALLAANQDQNQLTEYFIRHFGKAYLKRRITMYLSHLLRYRKTAKFLCEGILSDTLNIDSNLCKAETVEIIDALSKRMSNGRTLVYGNLTWSELLDTISKIAIEQKTTEFSENILKNGTLTRPPASTTEIQAAENRLSITLPEVYKEFLLTSNGFESLSNASVTLSAADKVDYFRNVDPQLIDIWSDRTADFDPLFGEKFNNSIIIGGHHEEQQLLLVQGAENQWECWHFATWSPGETVYQDFRYYMEEQLQSLENGIFLD